jgi:uncharacterized membrane protein
MPAAQRGSERDDSRATARGIAVAATIGITLWAVLIWVFVQILGRIW